MNAGSLVAGRAPGAARIPLAVRLERSTVAAALLLLGLLAILVLRFTPHDPARIALVAVGAALGFSLHQAAFGFTAGWRDFVVRRRSAGLRAQLILLGLASLLLIPALAAAPGLAGALAPIGTSLVVGSLLFGFGMQLGGGCGSGTLYTAGAGHVRMLLTLVSFIAGSVLGTRHLPWWLARPGIDAVDFSARLGVAPALALQLAVLAALLWGCRRLERRHHEEVEPCFSRVPRGRRLHTLIHGRWPLGWGALALALLSLVTLLLSGATWSITFAFGLWGAKALAALGVEVAQWEFWTWPYPAAALQQGIFGNAVSIMDFALILGALLGAGLAGQHHANLRKRIPLRSLAAALLGGLCMGYGARLGFGCNIGAMLSGIASASLHGWIWFACAFFGSLLGIHLRPRFGLQN